MKIIFSMAFLVPGLLFAEILDFDEAQKIALFNNPSIRAAYHTIEQARGRLLQAGLWPNPEIDLAYRSDVFFGGEGQDRVTVEFMQRFPWSGRLARARAVSRVEVAMALAEVRDAERKLMFDVQKAFIEARSAAEKADVLQGLIKSVDLLISLNEARRQAGQTSAIAVNLGKVEKEGLRQRLVALEADEGAALATLNGLLGRAADASLTTKGSLVSVIARLREGSSGKRLYRPDLVRTSLEADAATAEIALARAEAWDDITVGVEYEFERTLDGEDGLMNDNMLGFRVGVPLPLWNRNQGTIAEKTAGRERANQAVVAAQIAIEAEIAAARVRAVKAAAVAAIIQKDALPLLDETRGVLEKAIQTGQADTTEAITLTNQEIEQRLFHIDALVSQAQSLSEVEAALGSNRYLHRDIFINTLHEKKSAAKR